MMSEKEQLPNEEMEEVNTSEEGIDETSESPQNETPEESVQQPTVEQQLEEEKNKYLRLYAEFENFRRRNAKERIELISTASQDIVKEILPILDDFERALDSNKKIEEVNTIKEGFEVLYKKLSKTLESKGLKSIDSVGQMFDAEQHEAIAQVPVDKAKEKGIILDVVEKGYTLNEKIIRHPKVVVGS